jgi:hypothetical protein
MKSELGEGIEITITFHHPSFPVITIHFLMEYPFSIPNEA